jgi:hypothetical protein
LIAALNEHPHCIDRINKPGKSDVRLVVVIAQNLYILLISQDIFSANARLACAGQALTFALCFLLLVNVYL